MHETRGKAKNAALKDARIKPKLEECVRGMEQRSSDAAVEDVLTTLRKEEFVEGMGTSKNDVVVKDAQIMLRVQECAPDTGLLCSSERCTNKAQKEGVCIKHGAKHKRCSRKDARIILEKNRQLKLYCNTPGQNIFNLNVHPTKIDTPAILYVG